MAKNIVLDIGDKKLRKRNKLADRYYVYPEKGVVTCVISGTKRAALTDFTEITDITIPTTESMYIKDKYIGTARCNLNEDKFDELLGKDLAFERAYSAYISDKKNAMKYIAKFVNGKLNNLNNVLAKSKKYNKNYKELPRFKEIFEDKE